MTLSMSTLVIFSLGCLAPCFIQAEAMRKTSSCPNIVGLPGRDGRDGQPGRDGRDGLPGPAVCNCQQLKQEIIKEIRAELLASCNITHEPTGPTEQPSSTAQSLTPSSSLTSTAACNPTSTTPQPSSTPVVQPQCSDGLGKSSNPANSCMEIYNCNPDATSGNYWIRSSSEPVYCEMNITHCGNITGGWMRVINMDMTVDTSCPENFGLIVESSVRICRAVRTDRGPGCSSWNVPTHRVPYAKICGRARGYQFLLPESFQGYTRLSQTLDGYYVEGLSVTHGGTPRNHIWTFAAGPSKNETTFTHNCPCVRSPHSPAPPFLGEDYFCESGRFNNGEASSGWYLGDPLWDSKGCPDGSFCCSHGGPWFKKTLGQDASDDIEVRMCRSENLDEVGVDQLELYVQ